MRVRNLLQLVLLASFILQGCGGGGGGSGGSGGGGSANGNGGLPPQVPTVSVSGTAHDGLILQGVVRVYDYSGGKKGALIGSASTDDSGHYSVSIQIESMPVLLEVTGGHYKEEADSKITFLGSSDVMSAVSNFKTGTPITMAITPWTHIAAALASYKMSHGAKTGDAIDAANAEISNLIGVDITKVIPADVTAPSSISGEMSDTIRYGWLSAAISVWTFEQLAAEPSLQHVDPYTSIRLTQLMYDDVLSDGVLNGMGTTGLLQFHGTQLGVSVYRDGFAAAMLKFAGNSNNATLLTPTKILSAANGLRLASGSVFGQTPVKEFPLPDIAGATTSSNGYLQGKTLMLSTKVKDPTGVYSVTLSVDDKILATNSDGSNAASTSFILDTTSLLDGDHKVTLTATNGAGKVSTLISTIVADNSLPYFPELSIAEKAAIPNLAMISVNDPSNPLTFGGGFSLPGPPVGCYFSGRVKDTTSGVYSVDVELSQQNVLGGKSTRLFVPLESSIPPQYAYVYPDGMSVWQVFVALSPSFKTSADQMRFDAKLTITDKAQNSLVLRSTQTIDMTKLPYDACSHYGADDYLFRNL